MKQRLVIAQAMLNDPHILILDEPTNHLDLESITALNNGLISFPGTLLFTSHDHQFVQTIADRIIEILPDRVIDRKETYDEYLASLAEEDLKKLRDIRYWVRKATPGTEESKEPPKKQPIKEVLQDKADEKKAQRTAPAQAKHRQQDMEL